MSEDEDSYHSTFIGDKAVLDKCILTEEEMDEYLKKTEHIDPKEEHDHLYRTMQLDAARNSAPAVNVVRNQTKKLAAKVRYIV